MAACNGHQASLAPRLSLARQWFSAPTKNPAPAVATKGDASKIADTKQNEISSKRTKTEQPKKRRPRPLRSNLLYPPVDWRMVLLSPKLGAMLSIQRTPPSAPSTETW
jgi:hypothetical protein